MSLNAFMKSKLTYDKVKFLNILAIVLPSAWLRKRQNTIQWLKTRRGRRSIESEGTLPTLSPQKVAFYQQVLTKVKNCPVIRMKSGKRRAKARRRTGRSVRTRRKASTRRRRIGSARRKRGFYIKLNKLNIFKF